MRRSLFEFPFQSKRTNGSSIIMALFGTQLIITMVAACILQKLGPFYSMARWLLCSTGITKYTLPKSEALKEAVGILKSGKKKGAKRDEPKDDSFLIPKGSILELEPSPVAYYEVSSFNFYFEYQWLLEFALCAVCVFFITEVYSSLLPLRGEVNLSVLWCLMVIGFAIKILWSLTAVFFRSSVKSGEVEICAVSALSYFVVSMMVLVARDDLLELGLERAYSSFNGSATEFLQGHGLSSAGPASMLAFRLLLAVWSGLIGGILMFPGLRYTRMHYDCLKLQSGGRLFRGLCHLSFILPLLGLLFWVRPLARAYLSEKEIASLGSPLLTEGWFESARLWLLVGAVLVRLLLAPYYLQAYLNMALDRIDRLRQEAGRIRNTELHKQVVSVYYYLCAAALQLLAPLVLSLFLTLLYKSMGGYSWVGAPSSLDPAPLPTDPPATDSWSNIDLDEYESVSRHVIITLSALKRVFTPELYRGVLGYMVWWNSFVMFSSSVAGVGLLSYT